MKDSFVILVCDEYIYFLKTESVLKHTLIFINHHKNLFGDPVNEFQFIKSIQLFVGIFREIFN